MLAASFIYSIKPNKLINPYNSTTTNHINTMAPMRSTSPDPFVVVSPSRIVTLKTNADRIRALCQDYHQDIAPINGASTNADTIPTPALGATTPAPAPAAVSSAATGSPARAPTPGKADSSNAAAAAAAVVMPAEPAINGAPTRVYLNTKVTQHVLEGMKLVALKKLVIAPYAPAISSEDMLTREHSMLLDPTSLCASSANSCSSAAKSSRIPPLLSTPRRTSTSLWTTA